MNLQEFLVTANVDNDLALAEAQAYTETTYRKIGANEARQFFSLMGVLDDIEANVTNTTEATIIAGMPTTIGMLCKAVMGTLNSAGNQFATDPTHTDGQLNRGASALLVAAGVYPQPVDTAFFAQAATAVYPFANTTLQDVIDARDVGEVVSLPINNAQHILIMSITTKPSKTTSVKVQQRFGADNTDLTEWHDCGSFVGVNYTQQAYKTQIAASPTPYRELRAVSDVTIGMSIV